MLVNGLQVAQAVAELMREQDASLESPIPILKQIDSTYPDRVVLRDAEEILLE